MDILSIILAAIGSQKDRNNKISDRRIEAYRLNAEIAAEAAHCANTLSYATTNILRRVNWLFPDQPEVYQSVHDKLTTMLSQARQIQTMAEGYRQTIEKAIKIYEGLLENARLQTLPPVPTPQSKDRG